MATINKQPLVITLHIFPQELYPVSSKCYNIISMDYKWL